MCRHRSPPGNGEDGARELAQSLPISFLMKPRTAPLPGCPTACSPRSLSLASTAFLHPRSGLFPGDFHYHCIDRTRKLVQSGVRRVCLQRAGARVDGVHRFPRAFSPPEVRRGMDGGPSALRRHGGQAARRFHGWMAWVLLCVAERRPRAAYPSRASGANAPGRLAPWSCHAWRPACVRTGLHGWSSGCVVRFASNRPHRGTLGGRKSGFAPNPR